MANLKALLAFTRIPGNALSFWIRQTLHWSRGKPQLYQESKHGLFNYLAQEQREAEKRAAELASQFHLAPLAGLSTAALYRKNLYLIDTLEKATEGLDLFSGSGASIKALDVGSQDWHYVFALEKWLRYHGLPPGRSVDLQGLELDGYGIYADFHSRRDYAEAYAAQTGNAAVRYVIGDFLKSQDQDFDFISIFYPFVTRYQLLLWGLPLRFFSPRNFLSQAAAMIRSGGCLLVFCHTLREHELFMEMGRKESTFQLLREGPVHSRLVDFHADIQDRRFSIWKRA